MKFYRDLYAKDNSIDMQIQTDLIDSLEFSLHDIERGSCEGFFTKDELFFALKGLQTANRLALTACPPRSICLFGMTWVIFSFWF